MINFECIRLKHSFTSRLRRSTNTLSILEGKPSAWRRTTGPHDDVHHIACGENEPLPHDGLGLGEREVHIVVVTGRILLQERGAARVSITNLYHVISHQVDFHSLKHGICKSSMKNIYLFLMSLLFFLFSSLKIRHQPEPKYHLVLLIKES